MMLPDSEINYSLEKKDSKYIFWYVLYSNKVP